MARHTFWQIFRPINDSTIEVLRKIKMGAVELDSGATITKGTLVAGIDLFNYVTLGNVEIEGDEVGDTLLVKKIIYTRNEQ